MSRFVLFAVLILLAVRAVLRFLSGVVDGASRQERQAPTTKGEMMVRDPVCGTFVVRGRALTTGRAGDTAYFCSDKCRRDYLARRQ